MTEPKADPIGQFRNKSRETVTLEGSDGPKRMEMVKLHTIDFVRAGLPAVCFDITQPTAKRTKAAVQHMEEIQNDAERSLEFTVKLVKAAVVSPRIWGTTDPGEDVSQTPEGCVHWREIGSEYLELALLEAMRMSGLLTTEATVEAVRSFRELTGGAVGGGSGEALRSTAESAPGSEPGDVPSGHGDGDPGASGSGEAGEEEPARG